MANSYLSSKVEALIQFTVSEKHVLWMDGHLHHSISSAVHNQAELNMTEFD